MRSMTTSNKKWGEVVKEIEEKAAQKLGAQGPDLARRLPLGAKKVGFVEKTHIMHN